MHPLCIEGLDGVNHLESENNLANKPGNQYRT